MICLGIPYHFKSFKGCLPEILLGPFMNTLAHVSLRLSFLPEFFSGIQNTAQKVKLLWISLVNAK